MTAFRYYIHIPLWVYEAYHPHLFTYICAGTRSKTGERILSMKKAIIFSLLGGYVLGKAGNAIFGSKTAKKVYTTLTTGAFIVKDSIMEGVEKIQAEASDVAADAKVNVERYYASRDAAAERGTDAVCERGTETELEVGTDAV